MHVASFRCVVSLGHMGEVCGAVERNVMVALSDPF